jgi:hypothetical protein
MKQNLTALLNDVKALCQDPSPWIVLISTYFLSMQNNPLGLIAGLGLAFFYICLYASIRKP